MPSTYCPNCDEVIVRDNPQLGAMTTCNECDTKLEIISTSPFEVDFPLDYGEDWEDDEEEYDDDEEEA